MLLEDRHLIRNPIFDQGVPLVVDPVGDWGSRKLNATQRKESSHSGKSAKAKREEYCGTLAGPSLLAEGC